jgi:ribosomal protein S18 acetylase RimI-like enzyme
MATLIRTASAADLEALIALTHRTINASYRPFLGDEPVDAFLGSGAADRYIAQNLGRCLVLLRNGAIVGYSVCRDHIIDLMMIDHAVHRQGLGTELLRHVEQTLLQSHEALQLESFEDNENANAFYRKNGWREVSRHLDDDLGVRKIMFRKTADRAPPDC